MPHLGLSLPLKESLSSLSQPRSDVLATSNNVKTRAVRPVHWHHLGSVFCGRLRKVHPPLDVVAQFPTKHSVCIQSFSHNKRKKSFTKMFMSCLDTTSQHKRAERFSFSETQRINFWELLKIVGSTSRAPQSAAADQRQKSRVSEAESDSRCCLWESGDVVKRLPQKRTWISKRHSVCICIFQGKKAEISAFHALLTL